MAKKKKLKVFKKAEELISASPLVHVIDIDPKSEARQGFETALKLIISALTLVSALAWNEAVKALFDLLQQLLPSKEGRYAELIGLFIYALLVTLLTVFVINRLKKFNKKEDEEKDEV